MQTQHKIQIEYLMETFKRFNLKGGATKMGINGICSLCF